MVPPLKALIIAFFILTMLRAQDPWAVSVVEYQSGIGFVSGYANAVAALGRPSVNTYTLSDTELGNPSTAVVPVYPPWGPDQIVSIGKGGRLILKMGKPIINDPHNPYGVDFLVFGNALLTGGGLYNQDQNDPRTYRLSSSPALEPKWGEVAVSADGETWFYFPAAQRVGRLMPTLGKIWTGSEWGPETDPTIPPDPGLTVPALASMNLADLCIRYRGGAGGTGFNLDDLIVPDEALLPESFLYVKIFVPDDGNSTTSLRTEIDAVSVVSPVDGFTRWQQHHFAWTRDPDEEAPLANPDNDAYNNWLEYALGGNPNEESLSLPKPILNINSNGITFTLPASAAEAPWKIWSTDNLADAESWQHLMPQPDTVDNRSDDELTRTFILKDQVSGSLLFRLQLEPPQ